ncbi:ABC transporter permease [Leadbettera azotonutricia]|uniref:ABC transporter, permease protein n=1 Tax=Leadbettera azotonutricia (strain ATCC BAA-888 / DSM 13862 / ZAS-9) TaxID=545695 RepID=F5YAF7_LEAAZ|nr:ABC transporter permease [Leadbettera azotonutricia]AEF82023.1 ABC transporter, permease protein [Leadbettera azotonutricia ZAS-9]
MKKFLLNYVLPRIGQYIMVIFVGVTVTFIIPRLSPSDPVQAQINRTMTSGVNYTPDMLDDFRASLTALYGLEGSNWEQYLEFWGRLFRGDLGRSLSSFPTPVTELIGRSMPWTLGLLLTATIISWIVGNLLGGFSSYYPKSKLLGSIDVISQAVRPIPYYILALLLVIFFAYIWPIFPIRGAYPMGMRPSYTWKFVTTVLYHSVLPAFSLIVGGVGGWFIGMKSLTSNIISEDYVVYAETAGLKQNKILFGYVIRNAMLPQITGLALNLGMIFNGAMILEVIFTYPGIGLLAYQAILSTDYTLIMGITIFSIIGVATAALILDLVYPLFDPRVRIQ